MKGMPNIGLPLCGHHDAYVPADDEIEHPLRDANIQRRADEMLENVWEYEVLTQAASTRRDFRQAMHLMWRAVNYCDGPDSDARHRDDLIFYAKRVAQAIADEAIKAATEEMDAAHA